MGWANRPTPKGTERGMKTMRRTKGQALVETAITLPILLLIFLGMMAGGHWLLAYQSVQQATRVAAHQAAIAGGDPTITRESALNTLDGGMVTQRQHATVTVSCPNQRTTGCRRFAPITVTVSYNLTLLVPVPGLPDGVTIRSTVVRANERDQVVPIDIGPPPGTPINPPGGPVNPITPPPPSIPGDPPGNPGINEGGR